MQIDFMGELRDLFPDTITVQTLSAMPDAYGVRSVISSQDLPCRVTGRIRLQQGPGGEEDIASVLAIFPGVYGLTIEQNFILPERFVPRNPTPISVGHNTDEYGAVCERVLFFWKQAGA